MSETGIGTALTIIPKDRLPTILAADSDDILGKLFAELDGWEKDVSTTKGRAEIRSKIHKARIARADFKRLAVTLKEDAIKTQRAVNAEANIMDDCFESLIAAIGSELREIEAAEEATRKANEGAIAVLEALTDGLNEMSSEDIATRQTSVPTFTWAIEFRAKGERVKLGAIAQLHMAYQAAVRREADALAEVARLAEQAERDHLAAIEAQRVREEQIAAEAAEGARLAAEAEAERQRVVAEERAQKALQAAEAERVRQAQEAERQAQEAAEALARTERERLVGLERERVAAEKAETDRIAAHEHALSDFTFLVGSVAGQPGSAEVMQSIAQLQRLHANRDWEEFTERAAKERADTMATFQSKFQSAKAREKKAADELAEAQQKATIEAERQRVAREAAAQKAEDDRRAANRTHRMAINREAMADVIKAMGAVEGGSPEEAEVYGRAIITAIAKGEVRHIAINYAGVPEKAGVLL